MIIRPTAKFGAKLKIGPLESLPLHPNPLDDWSATLFTANRRQYLLVTNTRSLYSYLLEGKGLTSGRKFADALIESLCDALEREGVVDNAASAIESVEREVRFAKAHDRSVTGSMNDMIFHAKADLVEDGQTLQETHSRLNRIPFSPLKFRRPIEVFRSLLAGNPALGASATKPAFVGDKTMNIKKSKTGNSGAKTPAKAKSATSKPKSKSAMPSNGLTYQFKVTLAGVNPPIWRRIQVGDISLDRLHECIQTAMGWLNCHLHQFIINREYYGDPQLLEDDPGIDSTKTKLSDILPMGKRRFAFVYIYDFGDSWEHEVVFEGILPAESGKRYPMCVEGARACPPEDCGGIWGYEEFLTAIANPDHDEHVDLLEWCGGSWDAEKFDPALATKKMIRRKPKWLKY
ncbi:MAG: plasmid pRiA4b ORF-3 family protein [Pirellulaceae bacterium]